MELNKDTHVVLVCASEAQTSTIVQLLENTHIDAVIVADSSAYNETYSNLKELEERMFPYYVNDMYYDFDEFVRYLDLIRAMIKENTLITTDFSRNVASNVKIQAKQYLNRVNVAKGFRQRCC